MSMRNWQGKVIGLSPHMVLFTARNVGYPSKSGDATLQEVVLSKNTCLFGPACLVVWGLGEKNPWLPN